MSGDTGDTLGYSAASADIDGDGVMDIVVNEMVGNGLQPGSIDVGNLIILSGASVAPLPVPSLGAAGAALCIGLLAVAGLRELRRRRRS